MLGLRKFGVHMQVLPMDLHNCLNTSIFDGACRVKDHVKTLSRRNDMSISVSLVIEPL